MAIKAAAKRKIPNPLDYVDGVAMGRYLRSNPYPKPKAQPTPTTQIAPPASSRPSKRVRRYGQGPGHH